MERANGRSLADRNIEEPCWRSEIKIRKSRVASKCLEVVIESDSWLLYFPFTHARGKSQNQYLLPFFLKDAPISVWVRVK